MQAGNITREELWTSLQTTILRTLTYPLPCTQLSKKECEDIMSILLSYALPAMGFANISHAN
jgi:hypothetical protein